MSNLEMLQKLSLGTDKVENVNINVDDEDYDFIIRPLTDGEISKLQIIERKPYTMKMKIDSKGKRGKTDTVQDLDIGMGEFTSASQEVRYTAIAWSLSIDDEQITTKDVMELPHGVPELLFNEVIRISKLRDEDLKAIKNFRL